MDKQKINWKRLWEEFEDWSYNITKSPPTCKSCGQEKLLYDPPWELQQKKIEALLYERGVIINWHEVWQQFDNWLSPFECRCVKCNRFLLDYPEWPDQQSKIEQFIEEQLRKQ
jgi:hypothetical protein